jgi:hypothetical protein
MTHNCSNLFMKTFTRNFLTIALTLVLLLPISAHCYYSASTGRWLSRDPLVELGFNALQGMEAPEQPADGNCYHFVGNNPITKIDLYGLRLGDVSGEHVYPEYNPPAAGQKCCCSPASVITGKRTDLRPVLNWSTFVYSKWTFFFGVWLDVEGNPDCFRDIEVQWQRCWGQGGAGYMGSGMSIDVSVNTVAGYGNKWVTNARIFYLTCKGGLWTKQRANASLGYTWTGWSWEMDTPGGPFSN